jgi:hypothetical protein
VRGERASKEVAGGATRRRAAGGRGCGDVDLDVHMSPFIDDRDFPGRIELSILKINRPHVLKFFANQLMHDCMHVTDSAVIYITNLYKCRFQFSNLMMSACR